MKFIVVTGHRPGKAIERNMYLAYMIALKDMNPEFIISGMAVGADQMAARAAVALSIPFYAYVPFLGQEAKWPYEVQVNYRLLLQQAAGVKYVSRPPYTAAKMQRRNEAMINDVVTRKGTSDVGIMAVWNGTTGGTANMINYCQETYPKVPIMNLWPLVSTQPNVNDEWGYETLYWMHFQDHVLHPNPPVYKGPPEWFS